MNNYEGMFLFDPALSHEWSEVETEINRLLTRVDATLICSKKWDERRLAYEIKGRRRGLYVLVFFRADGSRIRDLMRDVELSESVLRAMILRADHLTEEQMRAVESAPPDSDRDRGYRDRGRDRSRGRRGEGRRERTRESEGESAAVATAPAAEEAPAAETGGPTGPVEASAAPPPPAQPDPPGDA